MCCPLLLLAARFLGHFGCLSDLHGNEMPPPPLCHCATIHYTSCKALWISVGFFPRKVSILMSDHWSLYEIWLQSVSSYISRLHFAEQGSCRLRLCTQCSLLKSGSHLSQKSEWLLHSTGHASTVCHTFEMTYVAIGQHIAFTEWCECIPLELRDGSIGGGRTEVYRKD